MGYDNTNRGVMFKNDKTHDAQPDYKGSIDVAGVQYWMSGWIKTSGPNSKSPGSKFLSVAIEQKDERYAKPPTPAAPKPPTPAAPKRPTFDDMDDDIPFSCGVA